ncbi:DUF6417 family protein, partial [Streptomyces sp. NPDC003233]
RPQTDRHAGDGGHRRGPGPGRGWLHVPPAEGLAERVRTARRLGNRWVLYLDEEQIESVAYALYLRSVGGSVAEANHFARQYGVTSRPDRSTGSLQPTRLP